MKSVILACVLSYPTFAAANAAGNFFSIASIASGQCAEVADDLVEQGTPIRQRSCDDNLSQRWLMIPTGDDSYYIISDRSGKCLQPYNSDESVHLVQWSCEGLDVQKWRLGELIDGGRQIISEATNLCMTLDSAHINVEYLILRQSACYGLSNQKWNIKLR